MQLFPVDGSFELQSCAVCIQTDVLNEGRIADAASYLQNTAQAACAFNGYRYILCSGDFLIDVVGINIPCIEQTRNIFI